MKKTPLISLPQMLDFEVPYTRSALMGDMSIKTFFPLTGAGSIIGFATCQNVCFLHTYTNLIG